MAKFITSWRLFSRLKAKSATKSQYCVDGSDRLGFRKVPAEAKVRPDCKAEVRGRVFAVDVELVGMIKNRVISIG